MPSRWLVRFCNGVNTLVLIGLAAYVLVIPGVTVWRDLRDPALRAPGTPRQAWRSFRYLTPRLESWARDRIASRAAGHLYLHDVPSTEWPMFTCVFYLWATENLQTAWETNPSLAMLPPRESAGATIEAAKDLLLDPVHHTWVRQHWGADYLHTQNVFFRSLLIAGLTSYERLTDSGDVRPVLRDQVDTLSAELDASPLGVLEDYPMECYPIDVLAAIAWMKRADALLGIDRAGFYRRAVRGFEGKLADRYGLIPYRVDYQTGVHDQPSRGIGMSHVLIFTPELWPDRGRVWYDTYEREFWQDHGWAAGFREYPRAITNHPTYDVDAGPIIDGFSISGNPFGLAAARANGRFDHAYTIASQVIAASWPLPDGSRLLARALSGPSAGHAPYLGEAAILYFLTVNPGPDVPVRTGGHWPGAVRGAFAVYFGVGALVVLLALWRFRRRWHARPVRVWQLAVWAGLLLAGGGMLLAGMVGPGLIALLLGQFFPRMRSPSGSTPITGGCHA